MARKLVGMFYSTENENGKMLEANPNWKRSMTVYQGSEKIGHRMRRRQAQFRLLLVKFLQRVSMFLLF